ncbi:ABC transporter substrate-binding protein [Streptomyces hygroscopicus]|uniref:Amino acid ABC transporter substrate-binding protein n=1 Tax=Streptomyces hygroscopicus TaxID=1912 RepID=A0ABQ3TQS8_STRHY|nr:MULTISPECIES: ABC transporter substrate-binding protein [Streptomyces]MDN3060515.1 ABC transporter substrate-binding protein [Streptomyces sp. SRF1]GHJ25698.1 amino acid ABC transporter substrate-binding protein [Streptomyces hygroscopicus]
MHLLNRPLATALCSAVALCAALTGCSPQPEEKASGKDGTATSCTPGGLATKVPGKLTVGTDRPAYAPWFADDDPSNGKGFESAVAYAVAKRLGYDRDDVVWQNVPFNSSFAPGAKKFDFDINQVSISEARKKAVAFSSGYYDVRQAVVALKSSKAAKARSLAGLKDLKLGAQVGTTSLDVINDLVEPTQRPAVYQRNDFAKSALKNGQVDAIVVDLPTAFYITGAEVPEAKVVGQFPTSRRNTERFGLVLDRDSGLTSCVSAAVDALRDTGTLATLEKKWLSEAVDAPVLT